MFTESLFTWQAPSRQLKPGLASFPLEASPEPLPTALTLHPTAWLRGQLTVGSQCSLGTGGKGPAGQPRLTQPVCLHSPAVPRVLRARAGRGGPESCIPPSERQPIQWPGGPPLLAPHRPHCGTIVSAPGPWVADGLPEHRRCGGRCQRASRHSHNWKTNILFLWCTFRPAHTQDGTCETTSLSAWREENSA